MAETPIHRLSTPQFVRIDPITAENVQVMAPRLLNILIAIESHNPFSLPKDERGATRERETCGQLHIEPRMIESPVSTPMQSRPGYHITGTTTRSRALIATIVQLAADELVMCLDWPTSGHLGTYYPGKLTGGTIYLPFEGRRPLTARLT